MEAGQLLSKSLPPKINLHEGREKEREREEGGGGRERGFQRGQKDRVSVSMEYKLRNFFKDCLVDHSALEMNISCCFVCVCVCV